MDKKIKLALIGCGGIMENEHVPALLTLTEEVEVGIIVEPSETRRAIIGDKIKVPSHKRFSGIENAVLEDIDVAVIATPHQSHFPIAEVLVNQDISVVIEKPPAASLSQFEKLMELSENSGSMIFVVHNYMYRPVYSSALAIANSGDIGDVFMFRAHVYDHAHFPGVKEFDSDWRTKNRLAGSGCLMDNGYHYLYLSSILIPSPVYKITAYMNTYQPSLDVEDLALASLVHQDGALTSIHCTWCVHGGGSHAIEIYGTKGTIKIKEDENQLLVFLKKEGHWKNIDVHPDNHHYEKFYQDVIAEFHRGKGQRKTRVWPEEARGVMELLDRLYEAAKSHEVPAE
jgi:predicted dehydrogenase